MPWSYPPGGRLYFPAAQGDKKTAQGDAVLAYVNVNTAAASAVLTIYDGQSTTGTKVAAIDCSSSTGRQFTYMIRCPNGIYAVLTGGNADVTVTYV